MKKLWFLIALAILLGAFSVDPAPAAACGGWWDPCCPWWQPDQCPPAVKKVKKDLAEKNGAYFDNARNSFLAMGGAICPWFPETFVACITTGTFAGISYWLSQDQKLIAKDPWDPDYWQAYEPPWPSAESLGLSYTNNSYLNNAISHVQLFHQMADMIYVSANRVSSCQQVGESDCARWQQERVDWALYVLGWALNEIGNEAWGIAYQVEAEGGADDLASLIREAAWTLNDSGWRFQQ